MEIKVRAVEDGGEKSVQEVEQELLEKHENSLNNEEGETNVERVEESVEDTTTTQEQESVQPEAETQTESSELNEEDVLSYLGKRYNKEINSFDDLMTERESSEELPEDVAAYLKFKKETGRGFNDFVNANRNYDDLDPNQLLKEYYRQTESELDEEDIDYLIQDKFGFDADLDEESEIKKKSIAKKKELSKAKNFFNDYKEKYSVPLESSTESISEDKQKELDAYQKYIDDAKSYQEELVRKAEWFEKKTKELFTNDFKGFDFKINDKELTYSPSDADELLKSQIDVNNFVGKYLDDKGMMKDAKGYHRALSIAMNPDKFAQFFYEQGKSDAVTESAQKSKNINFSGLRQTPEVSKKGGTQVKALSSSSSRGLKIRSKNKS